ncbi:MAG: sigma 54-interacting transcriptional regulator [Betaproteobacteria bacterium]|nr:sigma 54-interacting transcriptional regulator [Betaproteobacteria bacterium]
MGGCLATPPYHPLGQPLSTISSGTWRLSKCHSPLTGLVESLVDLQLFGATKGAYTGSTGPRAGLFETAMRGRSESHQDAPRGAEVTGGVVFLDEIGDLSPLLQAKLLPVLSGALHRLGGERQIA